MSRKSLELDEPANYGYYWIRSKRQRFGDDWLIAEKVRDLGWVTTGMEVECSWEELGVEEYRLIKPPTKVDR